MRKILSLTTVVLLTILVSACRRDRNPPMPDYRQMTFADEFVDNYNNWNFSDPANFAYAVVDESKGTMTMGYNDDLHEAYYLSQDIGFNRFNDFTLQTRIGSDNNMGLLFGYTNTGAYGYSFTVGYDGNFALYDEGGNGYGPNIVELVPLQTASFVNRDGGWNDLMLEQRGNRWIGYINNNQVFNIEAQDLKAGSIGYVLTSYTVGETDYLQADWLDY